MLVNLAARVSAIIPARFTELWLRRLAQGYGASSSDGLLRVI